MPNWDSVGFAIGQIGLSQIQQTIPDLHRQKRRSVSKIVSDYMWPIHPDISTTQPRRIITKRERKKEKILSQETANHYGEQLP